MKKAATFVLVVAVTGFVLGFWQYLGQQTARIGLVQLIEYVHR